MKHGYKAILYLVVLFNLSTLRGQPCKPQIAWGASISFCQGNTFTLNAANANSTYVWSTGATSSSITVGTSGTYWVSVTNQCGTTSDTIQVIVDQPIYANLGADRKICANSPTVLSVPFSPTAFYNWSTGASGNQISVQSSGTYWVEVTNACGTFTDTVNLTTENPIQFSLGADTSLCQATQHTLSLPSGITGAVLWSDASTGNSLSVSQSGTYWATVTNSCGSFTDSIDVQIFVSQRIVNADTFSICPTGTVTVNSIVQGSNYNWSSGSQSSSAVITTPGLYTVSASLPCGTLTDTFYVAQSQMPAVDLGPDTTYCGQNSVQLFHGINSATYLWSTGARTKRLTVSASGTYWVGVDIGCGYRYDTVTVDFTPAPNPIVGDTTYICGTTPDTLDAGYYANATYLWSDNSTGQFNMSLNAGSHWVEISNACGTQRKYFEVVSQSVPQFNFSDTTLCTNVYRLKTNLPLDGHTFVWSNGSSDNELRVRRPGTYWVSVTNACGTFSDTAVVNVYQLPAGIREDTIYKCSTDSIRLRGYSRNNVNYQWSNGSTTYSTWAATPGMYTLMSYNQCDTVRDTAYVFDAGSPLSFDLGADTVICRYTSVPVDLTSVPADSIVWDDGSKALVRNLGSGWHKATAYNICGAVSDSIRVTKISEPVKVLPDTVSFCFGTSANLDASHRRNESFLWNTGDTTASISVSQPGLYTVQISNECFSETDSVFVVRTAPLGGVNLGADTIFCAGNLVLDAGKFYNSQYLWHDGSTSRTLTLNKTGTYYVSVINACNTVSDTINVVVTGPPSLTLGNTVKFCRGSTLNLNAQNPICTYQWSTGDTTQSISVSNPGQYWVTITNDCGSLTDSVEVVVEDPLTNLSLGNDTIICKGDSILLETKIPGAYTKWKNGSATNSIYVKQTGDYWVEVSNSCGSWEDTVHVEVIDTPTFSLGADQPICATGGAVSLQGPSGMQSYIWSNGADSQSINITEAGTYWLTVINECFSYTDTIEVYEEYPINVQLPNDTVLCAGETLELNPNLPGHTLVWYDASNDQSKSIIYSGTYWVMARNSCGIYSDTVTVWFDEMPDVERETVQICRGDEANVSVPFEKGTFRWFDGSTDAQRSFDKDGIFTVDVTNQCGTHTKEYVVDVVHCDCPFFIPNAFTPNYDGTNDEFKVGHSCTLEDFKLQIFNRWGNVVFETTNADIGWDGTMSGQEMPAGVYTYSITYSWDVYGERHYRNETGVLSLMR